MGTENLAEAICCDPRTRPYAEPQFFFDRPDIALFSRVKGEATFYDSVCGIPLFTVPRNRTWADFEAETREHVGRLSVPTRRARGTASTFPASLATLRPSRSSSRPSCRQM